MLEKYNFEGFEVVSSSFTEKNIGEQGFIIVETKDPTISYALDEEENAYRITMEIETSISAFSGPRRDDPAEEDLAFRASANFTTFFLYDGKEDFEESEVSDNLWFFEKFNTIALHLVTENILSHTSLSYLPIPWSNR